MPELIADKTWYTEAECGTVLRQMQHFTRGTTLLDCAAATEETVCAACRTDHLVGYDYLTIILEHAVYALNQA